MYRDEYWESFAKSGSVEDYLRYAGYEEREISKKDTDIRVKENAGFYNDNGNGDKGGACG